MALPLLIAKDKDAKVLKDDYKLGWLMEDESTFAWVVWGSAKDYPTALKCARDVLSKKGNRKVFVSDEPLPRMIVVEKQGYTFKEVDLILAKELKEIV